MAVVEEREQNWQALSRKSHEQQPNVGNCKRACEFIRSGVAHMRLFDHYRVQIQIAYKFWGTKTKLILLKTYVCFRFEYSMLQYDICFSFGSTMMLKNVMDFII